MKSFCPYRVCPLGAHIDHQNGVVCGAAINLGITLEYEVSEKQEIIIISNNYSEIFSSNIDSKFCKTGKWYDPLTAAINLLSKQYSLKYGIKGTIYADLPSGGISSSTAVQISFIKAIAQANAIRINQLEIVQLCYKIEHDYLGLMIGKLDPYCEVFSNRNALLFLDTLTEYSQIITNNNFSEKYQFLVIYSGIERKLANTKYNERVFECMNAVKLLNDSNGEANKLRQIPEYCYYRNKSRLSNVEILRCKHYYDENSRVKEGLKAWRNNDMILFGKLMNSSCESSIENYQSGSKNLIKLHQIIKGTRGVLGTRFLGAGFNGSTLALIEKNQFDKVEAEIRKNYFREYPELKDKVLILPISLENGVEL